MLISGVFYFFSAQQLFLIQTFFADPKSRTILLIEIIVIYFIIYLTFYPLLKLLLRYVFHYWLRDKLKPAQTIHLETISDKKENIKIGEEIGKMLFLYVKLGVINSKDFKGSISFTPEQKEELFNDALNDLYSWITLIIHTGITLLIVYNYYAIWFIILFLLVLVITVLLTVMSVFFILNLEELEYARRDLVKRSKTLM
jgi:hypothetical protein